MNSPKNQISPKTAVGYVRCSTDEQGATSIPQQKEEIERWAIANDFKIVEWFIDEGKSGTSFLARPGFAELVRRVENEPDFDYVLVYDESRWGRALNPRENAYWKVHFERHRVKVRVIHSNSKNGDDIGSYVVEVVESAEASEYSKKLSRAIRRGMLSSQQGVFSRGGTAPYGYKRVAIDLKTGERRVMRDGMRSVPKQEKVIWELGDELEINTVKRIFEMRANGVGYVGIADILNDEGIPCPKRGRWKNKDQKWTGVSILGIIQNPAYVGERVYNRLSFSKILAKEKGWDLRGKWFNEKSEWIVVADAHPAIVSRELFEKANAQTEPRPVKPNQHYYRSTYLLTGLVKCVHCGFSYQGYHHKPTGNKYYIDGGYVNKGKSVCSWYSIRQDKLEDFILSSIKQTFLDPGSAQRVLEYVEEFNKQQPSAIQQRLESIGEILRENEGKIANLLSIAEEGAGLRSVSVRIRELEEIQEKLEQERRRLLALEPPKLDPKRVANAVRVFLEDVERTFDELSVMERKEALKRIVEAILVNREERKVRCYIKPLPTIPNVTDRAQIPSIFQGAASIPVSGQPRFQAKNAIDFQGATRSPNGNRTRISALRGLRPEPLDDRAKSLGKC